MRRAAVAVAAAAALLAPGAVAYAHVELKSVSPRKNSTRQAVRSVHATFTASLTTGIITIKTSSGREVPLRSSGLKRGNKKVLQAIPRSPLASGSYKVEWRALAPDGHRQRGSWSFRVRR
jgi:methionine-rich copper-binding protein CopC